MLTTEKSRMVVFIDWMNCDFCSPYGFLTIDVLKLRSFLKSLGIVEEVYVYIVDFRRLNKGSKRRAVHTFLRSKLEQQNFKVREKEAYRYIDPGGRLVTKGNLDVELAIDVMDFLRDPKDVNLFVLFSGDADFTSLLDRVHKTPKMETLVIASRKKLSNRLVARSDRYQLLDDIMPQLVVGSSAEK